MGDMLSALFTTLLAPVVLPGGIATSIAEIAGFVTGAACVWLAARSSVWTWPLGTVNSGFWLVLFLGNGLYADSFLQVVYLVMGFYGWWHWLHGAKAATVRPVARAPRAELAAVAAASVAGIVAWTWVLASFTNSTVPIADAVTTVLSLAANWLLARRFIENWPLWIAGVNVPYIGLYLYKGLALTAALQLVYIALSAIGWRDWRRELRGAGTTAATHGARMTLGALEAIAVPVAASVEDGR